MIDIRLAGCDYLFVEVAMTKSLELLAQRLERLLGNDKFLLRSERACWILAACLVVAKIIFEGPLQVGDIVILSALFLYAVAFKLVLARSPLV